MWNIYEEKAFLKRISKIPNEIILHYEVWKKIVRREGIQGLRKLKGFHDEALKGQLKGYRSSRLTLKWRVIYAVNKRDYEAYVSRIEPHNY